MQAEAEALREQIETSTRRDFSHIVRPLFDNFVSNVSTRSTEDLCRTTSSWVDQQCTLVLLRPLIKDSMRKLSTTTHVLSDPARLPNEARLAVQKNPSGSSSQAHLSSSTHHRSTREKLIILYRYIV
ncbi:putative MLX-interacting protein [Hypsibius exemplaris]|uniref:MLX-interacting protein n=1 Tax=Hypsibius exemplaris TaxID=2072580 RepID=A0A9X6NAP9_HYPEX|nr:putative MLX-interacting protein [Hypsibius exemplaris]